MQSVSPEESAPVPVDATRQLHVSVEIGDAVDAAVRLLLTLPTRPLLVAIDGRSGAGKSTYADGLAHRLDATVVRLDDIYPGWDGLAAAVETVATRVAPLLARGERAAYPGWDWTHDQVGEQRVAEPADVIIIEGVGAGAAAIRPWLGALIWLEADDVLRHDRAIGRDGEVFEREWDRWARQEESLDATNHTRAAADLVVDTNGWGGALAP